MPRCSRPGSASTPTTWPSWKSWTPTTGNCWPRLRGWPLASMRSKRASPAWTNAQGSSHASHSHRQGRAGGKGSVAWLLPLPAERGEGWREGSVLAPGVHPLVSTQVPSLPTRNEWGESRRQGNQQNAPPLPSPLLLPASGGEGEMLRNRAFLDLCRYQWGSPAGEFLGASSPQPSPPLWEEREITFGARRFVGREGHARHCTTTNKSTKESKLSMKILDIPQSGKRGLNVSMKSPFGQVSRIAGSPANP